MKKLIFTLFLLSVAALGIKAQTTIVVKGQINRNVVNQKVWINYYGSPSTCIVKDSTTTDSSGRYMYVLTIGSGCSYGPIVVNMLGCKGANDTLYMGEKYDSTTTNPDTMTLNFKYCDTCNVKANFSDTVMSGTFLYFQNLTSGSAHKYYWDFGDTTTGVSNSTSPDISHTYSSIGYKTVCLIAVDTVKNCSDTICKTIWVSPCRYFKSNFTYSGTGNTVNFTFISWSAPTANKFFWKFGDGSTSTAMNPSYNYPKPGYYNVCLTVRDTVNGCVDSTCFNVGVNIPCMTFYAFFSDSVVNKAVFFKSIVPTNAHQFFWDFGDGNTSSLKHPAHTYLAAGTYTVCLMAIDTVNGCTDSMCQNIVIASNCTGFNVNFSNTVAGNTASFTNTSTNANKFFWKFGDGNTSMQQNPVHTYATPGIYSVCLKAYDTLNNCSDSICKYVTVAPCAGFKGGFTYTTSSNGTVNFTNSSSSTVSTFYWDFGDGNNSTSASPAHNYATSGSYTVCLYVSDTINGCADTICQNINVLNCSALSADFSSTVSGKSATFTNNTIQHPGTTTTYYWVFGDGNSSTSTNPVHTYIYPGTYTVCLVAISSNGCVDSTCKNVVILPDCSGFSVGFSASDSCQKYTFTNTSTGANQFLWKFGDGQTSTVSSPTHTYGTSGSYTACLIARDTINNCLDSFCFNIDIGASLTGTIYRDSGFTADSGIVYLIEVTIDTVANDTILTAVDSAYFNSSGQYTFGNVPPGNYIVKAGLVPGSAFYTNRIPTYYSQSVLWRYAQIMFIDQACELADILLVTGTNPGGSAFVGGYVSVGANKVGDPLEKIQVLLFNSDGTPYGVAYTDANGQYRFNNILFGTYKVVVEIPGKPCEEYFTTLTAGKPGESNANFDVNTKDITIKTSGVGIVDMAQGRLQMYPNPASTLLTVSFDMPVAGNTIITITDMAGRQVLEAQNEAETGSNTQTWDVAGLESGFYMVTVKAGNTISNGKLIINK